MRRILLVLALAGFVMGCESTTPFAPNDDAGPLQPAEECTDHESMPC